MISEQEEIQYEMGFRDGYQQALKEMNAAEIERVRHGHWKMKEDPYMFFSEIPVCSVCGCIPKMRYKTAYCPHCGTKMDEASE